MSEITSETKSRQWKNLSNFLDKWFHKPDLEALLVLMSAYAAHFYLKEKPIWMFLLGASGTGKTEIGIKALQYLPQSYLVTDITTNAFLSGFQEDNGLLPMLTRKHGGNGVLLFSDLSPFLEKRQEARAEIVGQLRRIADGSFEKVVGNRKKGLSWNGKITTIAACTNELENYWSVYRSLGERFLTLRWRSSEKRDIALSTIKHLGYEEFIANKFRSLVREFVNLEDFSRVPTDTLIQNIRKMEPLATLIARMRVQVHREVTGNRRVITHAGDEEAPTRIIKALANLARGSATLFGRADCIDEDYKLAVRLGIDSLPLRRYPMVKAVMDLWVITQLPIRSVDLQCLVKMTKPNYIRVLEDLVHLELLYVQKDSSELYIGPCEMLCELWHEAKLN